MEHFHWTVRFRVIAHCWCMDISPKKLWFRSGQKLWL